MAVKHKVKLTYTALKLCVAVRTSRKDWHPDGLQPIEDLLLRAKNKLTEKKADGEIIDFFILPKPLLVAWQRIADQDPGTNPDVEIYIPFAYGVRAFNGATVEKSPVANGPCLLSIRAPGPEVLSWNIHALASFIVYTAMRNGWSGGAPDINQLKKIVNSAIQGKSVEKVPIVGLVKPAAPAQKQVAPRKIALQAPGEPTLTALGMPQSTAKAELKPTMTVAPTPANAPKLQGVLAGTVVPPYYPCKGLLKCQVSPDKMKGQIFDFRMSVYENKSLVLDEVWLIREIVRHGYVISSTDLIERVMGLVKRQQDLNGLVVAQGTEGIGGTDPDLRVVPPKFSQTPATANAGLRQTTVIPFYRKGDTVAEVYYKTPESPGMDVFGYPTPAPPGSPYKPEVGEGVRQSSEMVFEALKDGLLKAEKDKLDIVQTYMHEGDVSLASGDLDFDGNIIITGDIDSGCSVTARGDLEIHGSIRAAYVRCFGNLTVKGGINTGMKASVYVGASITVDYIENSIIYCKANVNVNKALLSSRVFSGGSITLIDASGRLAGGQFFYWDKINTAHIGFVTGLLTQVYMGANWREAIREHILTGRLAKLDAYLEKSKAEQRELARKTQGQMTTRHKDLLASLKEHLALAKDLIEALKGRQKVLRDSLKFNPEATVTVRAELAGDVHFMINGAKVIGDSSVAEFTVKTKAVNNTHFSKMKEEASTPANMEKNSA